MTMKKFRIIFMGTPDFAVPALKKLLAGPDDIVAVVTQPDRNRGRGRKLSPSPVKVVAQQHNLPILQPIKIRTVEFLASLKSYRPDLIVVAAYGRILPSSILNLPPLGCINIHGSLLPRHRGAAPIQWAVIKGDRVIGVTIMNVDEEMDTGDILLPKSMEMAEDDTAGSLFAKLAELGGNALIEALELLRQEKLTAKQQDHSAATMAPPLNKEDGLLDWGLSAQELHCLIRGLDPWPTAFTFLDGKRLRLFSPEIIYKDSKLSPGTILMANKQGILVATGENCLLIREVQPDGKKRMTAGSFICGHKIDPGALFTRN